MAFLSNQKDSQWGPSGIGTVVFGCVASILGVLTLWMMFWARQRESGICALPFTSDICLTGTLSSGKRGIKSL